MFGTVLNYICLRILGEGPDGGQDNACARARKWILDRGGVTHIPSWGKNWLSVCLFLQSFISNYSYTLIIICIVNKNLIVLLSPRMMTICW